MPILSLPTLALTVGKFGAGKTSLLKYLLLDNIDKFVGCLVFSNTGVDAPQNYDFVNPRYIYSEFRPEVIKNLLKLGKKIKKANPDHHILLILDGKSVFCLPTRYHWHDERIVQERRHEEAANDTTLV